MRLIDADALKEQTQFRLPVNNPIAEIYADCVRIHRENIDEAPTIDAEPVRHGHWGDVTLLKSNFLFRNGLHATQRQCTHCHRYSVQLYDCPEIIPKMYQYRFCPHCGAKMLGGE